MQKEPSDLNAKGASAIPAWFLTLVSVPIIVGILWVGRDFLMPLALAVLLFILNIALIDRLKSATIAGRKLPNWVAYIGATALLFALVAALAYTLMNQASAIGEAAPRYAARLSSLRDQFATLIGAEWAASFENAVRSIEIQSWLTGFAASVAGAVGNIGLIFLYVAFMLAERGSSSGKLKRLFATSDKAEQVQGILDAISVGVRQYMWINAATSAMSGTLAFVVMTFLGMDFALPLAFLVFSLNFIPSIGSFLAVFFPSMVALLQFDTILPALVVIVVYGGGDAIIGNVIQPRMQGKSLNLSTFVVMIALTFWTMTWGGIGAFIAVPLTVVIMIVCSEIPGLQFFARLLSSDGGLPQEQVGEEGHTQKESVQKADQSLERSSGFWGVTSLRRSKLDGPEELALLKQELLERKTARRGNENASLDTSIKQDEP